MDEIIRTENLSKYYGKVHAADGISLRVGKGEIYGFLGLNGAGKTTTIRMLLGMVRPSSGASFLCNRRVRGGNFGLWNSVGFLVEIPYSYPDLTVRENLEITRRLRLIKDKHSIDSIIERMKLGEYSEIKARNLSLGNAQRLGLARALIHKPEILILDEPSNGLDPAGIVEIREMLKDLAFNQGVTIFISSHILGEISRFATRIGIIHKGRLLQEADADSLDKLRRRRLLIKTIDNTAAGIKLKNEGYSVNQTNEGILEITGEKALNHPEEIAAFLVHSGLPPSLLNVEEEDLESYFLRIIGVNGGVQ